MNRYELAVFSDEIEKLAVGGQLLRRGARWLTEYGPLRGALTGAASGAGVGAGAEALRGGDSKDVLRGAVLGGVSGGALGGAAGGVGRRVRDVRLLNPGLSAGQTAMKTVSGVGNSVANFGKRQVHGFTGLYKDRAGDIGIKSKLQAENAAKLEKLRFADRKGAVSGADKIKKLRTAHKERLKTIAEEGAAGQGALDAGITSLPGVAKGLATAPRETAKAMWRYNSGKGLRGKLMNLGAGPLLMAPELAKGDESDTGGKGMGQKLLNTAAFTAPQVALGRVALLPGLAGWTAADSLANAPFKKRNKVTSA